MSNINEKAIRIVAFSGKSIDYRMWAARFMAAVHIKSYSKYLLNDFTKSEQIEKAVREAVAKNEDGADMRMNERKKVKDGLFPDGDAYMAWGRLRSKHQPTTNSQKIMLRREFHRSRLGKATRSPDEGIEEFEIIRSRLTPLSVQIEDEDLVM